MSTSTSSASSKALDQLREQLQSLEEHELPEWMTTGGDTTQQNLDPSLLQQYRTVRDDYIRRKIQHSLIAHLKKTKTFDGAPGSIEMPEVPSEEEMAELQERRDEILKNVTEWTTQIQSQMVDIQAKQDNLAVRKQELRDMIDDLERRGDDDDMMMDDDVKDVSDQELQEEQERLQSLQEKKAQLQAKLAMVQQENLQMQRNLKDAKVDLSKLDRTGKTPVNETTLKDLQENNLQTEKTIAEYQEIQSFYDSMREVMEELRGIRVLTVEHRGDTSAKDLLLKVQLKHKYDVEIEVSETKCSSNSGPFRDGKDGLEVTAARFVQQPIVRAPGLEMSVPGLDDLVQASKAYDGLRFLLREAINRISVMEARVLDVALLQQETVSMEVGQPYQSNGGLGGHDQDIVCKIDAPNSTTLMTVLRLTPDCPLLEGSVYVDQLAVSNGSFDRSDLENVKGRVNDMQLKSPVELIQALKQEIVKAKA